MKNFKVLGVHKWLFVVLAAVCMAWVGLNIFNGYLNSLLQVIGITLLLVILYKNPEKALTLSWTFAVTWLSVSVWWLYIALHEVGGLPSIISVLAILLLCGGLGFYYAAALKFYIYTHRTLNAWVKHALFASCWMAAELARAQWFTGFPWSAIGYSHVNGLLSFAAPWIGVYGIGFLAAYASSWLAVQILSEEKTIILKIKIVVLMLLLSLPAVRDVSRQGKVLNVNLLQANISQTTKFNSGRQQALDWYAEQLGKSKAELTVLPEIAIPYFQHELPPGYWDSITGKFKDEKQIALLGIPTLDKEKGYGNSAVGLGFGIERQYDKYHLVPFGEFTPESMKWFTRLMVNEMGDFNRGSVKQSPFVWQGHNLSMTICYEDLFGEDLAVRFVETNKIPTVFINISNIAWFGDSMVVNQHLDIARMRSLEFDRPTIRATNTGGTAIISAEGRIVQQLPSFVRGSLQGQVLSKEGGITPFAYWAGHWGLMPLWLVCLFFMSFALYVKSRTEKINQHL